MLESWALGFEASWVMALRMMRIGAGGAVAEREARRMVEEKFTETAELAMKLMWGGWTSPRAATRTAVKHYGRTVRANRRRLEG